MNDFITSLIRTNVPIIVGSIISYLSTVGLDVDTNATVGLVTFLTAFFIATYYLVVRLLERRFPQVGILLGSVKTPVYTDEAGRR